MQFLKLASLLASAALVSATNTVTFVSLDDVDRTIYWTGNSGSSSIEDTAVAGGQNVTVEVPESWVGNFYSVSSGKENTPGMLGEIAFNSWGDITFFDVSAIVNPNDVNGVSEIYPASAPYTPVSGCKTWPCDNAYYASDDVQTKSTSDTDLICTLSTNGLSARAAEPVAESESFPRDAVTSRMWRPRN
ncbi:hypothetical protein NKR23_g5057 [Pleurostoma richardsiae]|uniref:DNase1 protein n=1 Tax=Pleurostoma richardsiae TaxID=41990 RepID=A0AA38RGM5_9PEZI|nr:hypothetical protein NKR23_g5057 [Pleurostoma richardsiae]